MKRTLLLILASLLMLSACQGALDEESKQSNQVLSTPAVTTETVEVITDSNQLKQDNSLIEKSGDVIPLIFSHDGAPDDISTMVYLTNHPDIDVLGVIQSYGEQHPSKSLEKWQIFIYDVLDYDSVRIGVGSETSVDPAQNEFPSGWRSSADGFWGLPLPGVQTEYEAEDGVELLIDLIKSSPEKVVVLVTGAQTDMALALEQDPTIVDNITEIVIMGGAFNVPGNLNESSGHADNNAAEWNIYADPLAAKIVFNSGVPLSIVSLDGSDDFYIGSSDINKISNGTGPGLDLLSKLWEQSSKWWGGDFKIWDIVAVVAVTHPQHFTWEFDQVDVIAEPGSNHGQTIALGKGSDTSRFSFSTDYGAVRETIFEILK